jgi:hypothetical protein
VKSLTLTEKIVLTLWLVFTAWQFWSLTRIQSQACSYAYTAERYISGSRDVKLQSCP